MIRVAPTAVANLAVGLSRNMLSKGHLSGGVGKPGTAAKSHKEAWTMVIPLGQAGGQSGDLQPGSRLWLMTMKMLHSFFGPCWKQQVGQEMEQFSN